MAPFPGRVGDQSLELVQISLQTPNPFARFTVTADDKGAGMAIARFSGFLKESWRANDWTWGRLDAATMLCRVLLSPQRLRRVAFLSAGPGSVSAEHLADGTLGRLVAGLFGHEPADPRLTALIAAARAELVDTYQPDVPTDGLPLYLASLADLAAWALHVRIAAEELPALARCVTADQIMGASRSSHGALFLASNTELLERLGKLPAEPAGGPAADPRADDRMQLGLDALDAFDRAGIGHEALAHEATSDQMIRTAVTAAGVAVTVLDGERSGLPAIKPVGCRQAAPVATAGRQQRWSRRPGAAARC